MAGKNVLDNYDQYAMLTGDITLSAPGGTSAVSQLITGLSNLQKVAWLTSRIEYWPASRLLYSMTTGTDRYSMCLSASASLVQAWEPVNAAIYDEMITNCVRTAAATSPSLGVVSLPIVHEFKNPILILPQNIYLFEEVYCAAAILRSFSYVRIWYKELELSSEDWYDLLQLRMPLGAV